MKLFLLMVVCICFNVDGIRLNAKQPWCSSEADYIKGSWVFNESPDMNFPFTEEKDPNWQPTCDAIQKQVLAGAPIPNYLRYEWKPETCVLEKFDRLAFCAKMNGKTIGVMGDSTSQHFARTLTGLMLGHVNISGDPYRKRTLELCPKTDYLVRLVWHRLDNWPSSDKDFRKVKELLTESDVVVLNWGPHYAPDGETAKSIGAVKIQEESNAEAFARTNQAVTNLKALIQQQWPPKALAHIFWRASIAFHNNCQKFDAPHFQGQDSHLNEFYGGNYFASEIMKQERNIVWPAMRALGATILRTDSFTKLRVDGHRKGRKKDCLHYCEPGPLNTWIQLFHHYMMDHITE